MAYKIWAATPTQVSQFSSSKDEDYTSTPQYTSSEKGDFFIPVPSLRSPQWHIVFQLIILAVRSVFLAHVCLLK